jgi:hypothetical protein
VGGQLDPGRAAQVLRTGAWHQRKLFSPALL